MVIKLEKLDFKLRKPKLDIKFLCNCENNDIIPHLKRIYFVTKRITVSFKLY